MRDIDIIYREKAAKFCGVSLKTLDKWDKSGKLKSKRHPLSKDTIYSRRHLENFLKVEKSTFLPKPADTEMIQATRMCYENSCNLLEDSKLLFSNGSYGPAFSICAIALEELGKALSCLDPVTKIKGEDFSWIKFWDEFYMHSIKIGHIYFYMCIAAILAKLPLQTLDKLFEDIEKHPKFVNMQKQNGFYVDYIKSPKRAWFESPRKMVKKSDAKGIIWFTQVAVDLVAKQKIFSDESIKKAASLIKAPFFGKMFREIRESMLKLNQLDKGK